MLTLSLHKTSQKFKAGYISLIVTPQSIFKQFKPKIQFGRSYYDKLLSIVEDKLCHYLRKFLESFQLTTIYDMLEVQEVTNFELFSGIKSFLLVWWTRDLCNYYIRFWCLFFIFFSKIKCVRSFYCVLLFVLSNYNIHKIFLADIIDFFFFIYWIFNFFYFFLKFEHDFNLFNSF